MRSTISKSLNNKFPSGVSAGAKLFAWLFFFTGVLLIFGGIFLPPVFAQESDITENQKNDEKRILTELRTAKNLIENEEWEKAGLKLTGIIKDFPRNRYLDIAYYWLAYALFQQQKLSEAERVITDLQRDFPNSPWIDESKSLVVEINSKNGRQMKLADEEFTLSDDEMKAFAVQNLLRTDRVKAVRMIDNVLSAEGKATDGLKESVLILLLEDKSEWATNKFIQVLKTETGEGVLRQSLIGLGRRDEKKVLPVLRDFIERNENENLLDSALYAVSANRSEASLSALIYYAQSGGSDDLKQKSIIWLGNLKSKRAIGELKKLYGFYTALELKKQVQISLSEINTPEALQALIDLLEIEKNEDLNEHGLELLKEKTEPSVLKYLEKKLQGRN